MGYLQIREIVDNPEETSDEDLEKLCSWNPECKEALDELHRQHQKAIFDAI